MQLQTHEIQSCIASSRQDLTALVDPHRPEHFYWLSDVTTSPVQCGPTLLGDNASAMRINPLEQYVQNFLQPAHPTRWLLEPVRAIRRDQNSWYQFFDKSGHPQYRQFQRNAMDCHINAGYYEIRNWRDELIAQPKLTHLWWHNWRVFRCNVARRLGQKVTKHWLLVTYTEDQPVSFIQFDLDRHYWDGMSPEEKLQVDAQFERNLENLKTAAQSIGFEYLLTTSPGDIYDGQWIHGAYVWIKIDNLLDEYTVERLRPLIEQFCDYWGLETEDQDGRVARLEFSWDKKHRPIRLPGQYRVELLDPETLEIIHPAAKPNDTLAWFMDAWAALKPVQVEYLFAESMKAAETERTVSAVAESSSSYSVLLPPNTAPITPRRKYKRMASLRRWSVEECLAEGNTFTALTKRKICHDLAWKYDGNRQHIDQAVLEAVVQLRQCRPSSSKTCGDPLLAQNMLRRTSGYYFDFHDAYRAFTEQRIGSQLVREYQGDRRYLDIAADEALDLLRPFLGEYSLKHLDKLRHRIRTQWLDKFYFGTFDPAKAKGKGTNTSRDKADRERLGDSLNLDVDLVLCVAGRSNQLSYDQKADLKLFMKWWKQYVGRVAAKRLYSGPKRLFTKTQWDELLKKLKDILFVVEGADINNRKCRQWGFTQEFLKRVAETEALRKKTCEMVERDKEKEVYILPLNTVAEAAIQPCGTPSEGHSGLTSVDFEEFRIGPAF